MMGFQGAYSEITVQQPKDYRPVSETPAVYPHVPIDLVYVDKTGGNSFGPGIHGLLAFNDNLLLRVSYMYYRISRQRGEIKGEGSNPELGFYFKAEEKRLFLFVNLGLLRRNMNKAYTSQSELVVPSIESKSLYLNFGFGFPVGGK